jgi:hypothetical protein
VIYSAEIIIPSSNGKRMEVQTQYFFSKNLSSTIFPLTILNLKKAFADNLKLHDALEMEFSKSTSIATYDSNQKMYTINFLLLSLSNNQN